MVTYRESIIERIPLHKIGIHVVATSFGSKNWDYMVGEVVEYKKHTVEVVFKDDQGQPYSWRFSLLTGRRTQDIGSSHGWHISLDDLKEWKPPAVVHKPRTRTKKVHEEIVELKGGKEVAVWQVFKDKTTGRFYFKAFRRNIETGKEQPYTAPIEKVLEVLHLFITDW